jgi:hypothetical protein
MTSVFFCILYGSVFQAICAGRKTEIKSIRSLTLSILPGIYDVKKRPPGKGFLLFLTVFSSVILLNSDLHFNDKIGISVSKDSAD